MWVELKFTPPPLNVGGAQFATPHPLSQIWVELTFVPHSNVMELRIVPPPPNVGGAQVCAPLNVGGAGTHVPAPVEDLVLELNENLGPIGGDVPGHRTLVVRVHHPQRCPCIENLCVEQRGCVFVYGSSLSSNVD